MLASRGVARCAATSSTLHARHRLGAERCSGATRRGSALGMMGAMDDVERLTLIRAELRFELGLLHDRVNALLAAEAFLTIAYTAAMSNSAPWSRPFAMVVAPALSLLGLLLALLARPGVTTTARLVLDWTRLSPIKSLD